MEQKTNDTQIEQEYMAYAKKDLLRAVYKEEGNPRPCVYKSNNSDDIGLAMAALTDYAHSRDDGLARSLKAFGLLIALLEAAKH